jgi:hypothetical protein
MPWRAKIGGDHDVEFPGREREIDGAANAKIRLRRPDRLPRMLDLRQRWIDADDRLRHDLSEE